MGFGTVTMPFNLGKMSLFALFLLILVFVALLILYVAKLKKSPYGRLLLSIQDNEILAQSLGKPTYKHKVILFAISCAAIGLFGALTAPLYSYIFPRMIGSSVTFTVWIALMLGGRKKLMGGLIGVLATVGMFDYFIETVVPIPRQFAELVPNLKFAIYGLMLILVLMFRPLGILGDNKKGVRG
jgi:branched-chain amino acid transport system permease protein